MDFREKGGTVEVKYALMNTEMEETKSRCGIRMSGDVIAKSTRARTPDIPSSNDVKDRLRLIFQAINVLSMASLKIHAPDVPL
jgi:hypothetical protein